MAIGDDLVKAYATQFLPQFQFTDTENIFPVSADSWLVQCAQGDWQEADDPHAGTTVVITPALPELADLIPEGGCRGVTSTGAAGSPFDPAQPLPTTDYEGGELFIDFAGWSSLETNDGLSVGDSGYVEAYYSDWFAKFSGALSAAGPPPPTNSPPVMPTAMPVYCEAAWAGDFTRLAIRNQTFDFAPGEEGGPDRGLDTYLVLSYYLFYPCTESPPPNSSLPVGSSNIRYREGQWEAVSLYFDASPIDGVPSSAEDLTLPPDPSKVTPAYAVLSSGITESGDGRSPQISRCYPAIVGPWSTGGQVVHGSAPGGEALVPQEVYVTSGTHKNLFDPTPTTSTSTPDQGWNAVGNVLEAGGGASLGYFPVGTIVGLISLLIGFLLQAFEKDTTYTPQPNANGDIASSSGPAAGAVPKANTGGGAFVNTELIVTSLLPGSALSPPAWWSFPGRWGVAMTTGTGLWDSGGRRIDFKGRSRAYWNTVWLHSTEGI